MSRVRVGVIGASGFLGGELVRLLAVHPKVDLVARVSGSTAGRRLSEVRPSLRGPADGVLEALDADALATRCDWVFLALPHGTSGEVATALHARGVGVIDLGSDLRLRDPADHERYYKRAPAAPELLDAAFYSLPELTGPIPDGCRLIANPGCFATALALCLAPVAGHVEGGAITVFGVTGSSGSGVAPSAGVHHSTRVSSFIAYKPLVHQHLGELRQLLATRGAVPTIRFIPHSLPAARGIHLTVSIPRAALRADPLTQLTDAYAEAPLVDVVRGPVPMGAVQQSCRALIGVGGDDDTVLLFCAIDNLLKGGSGQAVQNLNLAEGWDATLGLPTLGAWP